MKRNNNLLISSFFNNYISFPGSCAEVRCFNSRVDYNTRKIVRSDEKGVVAGWFTSAEELACELSRVDSVSVYITVNPVSVVNRPSFAKNNLSMLKKGHFCTDKDIFKIRYMIIDIDPINQSDQKVNSTDYEQGLCVKTRDRMMGENGLIRGINCIAGRSGNGAFVLIKIDDLENNKSSLTDIHTFIDYMSNKYSDQHCKVDNQVRNPSRMLGIPGTWKFKGTGESEQRPYRLVTIDGGESDDVGRIRSNAMANGTIH